jgi:hypothetical protein
MVTVGTLWQLICFIIYIELEEFVYHFVCYKWPALEGKEELQREEVGTVKNVGHQCEQDVQGAKFSLSMPWMHKGEAEA